MSGGLPPPDPPGPEGWGGGLPTPESPASAGSWAGGSGGGSSPGFSPNPVCSSGALVATWGAVGPHPRGASGFRSDPVSNGGRAPNLRSSRSLSAPTRLDVVSFRTLHIPRPARRGVADKGGRGRGSLWLPPGPTECVGEIPKRNRPRPLPRMAAASSLRSRPSSRPEKKVARIEVIGSSTGLRPAQHHRNHFAAVLCFVPAQAPRRALGMDLPPEPESEAEWGCEHLPSEDSGGDEPRRKRARPRRAHGRQPRQRPRGSRAAGRGARGSSTQVACTAAPVSAPCLPSESSDGAVDNDEAAATQRVGPARVPLPSDASDGDIGNDEHTLHEGPTCPPLPSESGDSGDSGNDRDFADPRATGRAGLASPAAHGPSTVPEVQGLFMWPRDAVRMSDPLDASSFLNRVVVMATFFSGLGSAELAADMLRSWAQTLRGKPLSLTTAYSCEKKKSLHRVLIQRAHQACLFVNILDRLLGMPEGIMEAATVDFDAVTAAVMQCTVTERAPCAAHGQSCVVPRSNFWVLGPSCKPWSRARHRKGLPPRSHKDVVLLIAWCRILLADLPDVVLLENVIGFPVSLLIKFAGQHYHIQHIEMRPEDLGFSFIMRPRLYIVLARRERVALADDAFALFRRLQSTACRQRAAPPAVMAATEDELLQEENLARRAKQMPPLESSSSDWRYLLSEDRRNLLAEHEANASAGVTASVVDLSQSTRFGRLCPCVPTLRASTIKPLWLMEKKRWLLHSELAAMMGFPVAELWSQVSGVPLDTATAVGPPNALGNAMHVACVGVAMACALASSRHIA